MNVERKFSYGFIPTIYTKKSQKIRFPWIAKEAFVVMVVVSMFGTLLFYESNSKHARMQKLESKLNDFDKTLNDISKAPKRFKRNLASENHILTKRQSESKEDSLTTETPQVLGGATFIRWGRRDCKDTTFETTLVYSGIAATNHHNHHGGGANFLCLDVNVSYPNSGSSRNTDGFQSASFIYGMEYYETRLKELFDYSLIEGGTFFQFNVPCSVCMSQGRANQLMIPGQDLCPRNWKKEYTGYIMGPHHGQDHSGQYICVDEKPQIVHGSDQGHAGEHLYLVETECPSLQCGPYVRGRELRCVVCTI